MGSWYNGLVKKMLIMGQAPSKCGEGESPFSTNRHGSGRRLVLLLGTTPERFRDLFDLVNLIKHWPGKQGKGDAFPLAEAKIAADQMRFDGRPAVLLAGRGVAAAFGQRGRPYLEWFELRGVPAAVLPHPSGINRWWNDAENCVAASLFMHALLSP